MIIGRGDIAKAITDIPGYLIYCNGASNRLPLDEPAENKEHREVWRCHTDHPVKTMFVYISTLDIYYSDTPYTRHKLRMEKRVKEWFRNYCILRIGNITWGNNPNTLINHLRGNQTDIRDEYRYLLSKDELNHWIGLIPKTGQHEMNITGERMKVQDIATKINLKQL